MSASFPPLSPPSARVAPPARVKTFQTWSSPPRTVLIVKKWNDVEAKDCAEELGSWLRLRFGVRVVVYEADNEHVPVNRALFETACLDAATHPPLPLEDWCGGILRSEAAAAAGKPRSALRFPAASGRIARSATGGGGRTSPSAEDPARAPSAASAALGAAAPTSAPSPESAPFRPPPGLVAEHALLLEQHRAAVALRCGVDLIVTIGGDGTVLHASGLFPETMPPLFAIAFGSLGFMTSHNLDTCAAELEAICDPRRYGLEVAAWPPGAASFQTTSPEKTSGPASLLPTAALAATLETAPASSSPSSSAAAAPTLLPSNLFSLYPLPLVAASVASSVANEGGADSASSAAAGDEAGPQASAPLVAGANQRFGPSYGPAAPLMCPTKRFSLRHCSDKATSSIGGRDEGAAASFVVPARSVSDALELSSPSSASVPDGAGAPAPPLSSSALAAAPSLAQTPRLFPVSERLRLVVNVFRPGPTPVSTLRPYMTRVVLNEILIDRGESPAMSSINAFVDNEPLTTVSADGLVVSTPTGSTAYALSAGGSIVSPDTASICLVPICPHTLSFRPIFFPDSAVLCLEVPQDARAETARCAFDGRDATLLERGDFVVVHSSPWPMPLLSQKDATEDWLVALKSKLYWNHRVSQKAFQNLDAPEATIAGARGSPCSVADFVSFKHFNASSAVVAESGSVGAGYGGGREGSRGAGGATSPLPSMPPAPSAAASTTPSAVGTVSFSSRIGAKELISVRHMSTGSPSASGSGKR